MMMLRSMILGTALVARFNTAQAMKLPEQKCDDGEQSAPKSVLDETCERAERIAQNFGRYIERTPEELQKAHEESKKKKQDRFDYLMERGSRYLGLSEEEAKPSEPLSNAGSENNTHATPFGSSGRVDAKYARPLLNPTRFVDHMHAYPKESKHYDPEAKPSKSLLNLKNYVEPDVNTRKPIVNKKRWYMEFDETPLEEILEKNQSRKKIRFGPKHALISTEKDLENNPCNPDALNKAGEKKEFYTKAGKVCARQAENFRPNPYWVYKPDETTGKWDFFLKSRDSRYAFEY